MHKPLGKDLIYIGPFYLEIKEIFNTYGVHAIARSAPWRYLRK
jgi:hypothetical protein